MPPRYRRDIKKCTVEIAPQQKPYIGYTDKIHQVVKMRTFNRKMVTWKNIHETDAPIERQFSEENNLNPSCWFDSETMQVIIQIKKRYHNKSHISGIPIKSIKL